MAIFSKLEKNEEKQIKNVVIYTRVSTRDQVLGFSLEKQKLDLLEYCKRNNYTVIEEFSDEGKSGKNTDKRDEYKKLVESCKYNENIDAVIVWKLSRISRKVLDLLNFINLLKEQNIAFISIQDNLDTSNGSLSANLMVMILGMIAEMEGENIVVQSAAGMVQRAEEGKFMGGPIPLGYKLDKNSEHGLIINTEQSLIINKIFDDYVNKNKSLTQIIDELNSLKVINSKGNSITKSTLSYILANQIYIGNFTWNKKNKDTEKVITSYIPEWQIINNTIFSQAQEKLKLNKHKTIRQNGKYLLSGLITCPLCGRKMTADSGTSKNGKVHEYYACKNKSHKRYTLKKDDVEKLILDEIGKALINGSFADAIKNYNSKNEKENIESEIKLINKNIAIIKRDLNKTIQLKLDDKITTDNFDNFITEKNKELKKQSELLDKKVSEQKNITSKNDVIEDIDNILNNFSTIFHNSKLNMEEKNRLISLIVEDITLYISNDFKIRKVKEIKLSINDQVVRLGEQWQGV